MSRSPFFFVEKYNLKTEKYESLTPFIWDHKKDEPVPADLWPHNGSHELFAIVENNTYNEDLPAMCGIHNGMPKDVNPEIQAEYSRYTEDNDDLFNYQPPVRWFTYADMYIYCLEHPEVKDYDAMEEAFNQLPEGYENTPLPNIMKSNPMISLKNRVDSFLEVVNDFGWEDDRSLIRIVYWIS